jgi:quercetin dioxygenase-like cupin family protein
MRTLSLVFLGAALVACAPAPQEVREEPATEPTPAAAALPEGATVVLDGPYATVTRFDLQPGQAQSVHEGPDRVIYSLNDYTLEWTEGDAEPAEKSWTAGDTHWHTAGPHAARNVGEEVARYVVVARTDKPLPAAEDAAEPEVTAGGHGTLLFENDNVRVVEVTLEPGQATPSHPGGHRVIYSLGDYTIRWTEGDAEPTEATWAAGEAHWHDPAEHSVENIGETPARYLVFTFPVTAEPSPS